MVALSVTSEAPNSKQLLKGIVSWVPLSDSLASSTFIRD